MYRPEDGRNRWASQADTYAPGKEQCGGCYLLSLRNTTICDVTRPFSAYVARVKPVLSSHLFTLCLFVIEQKAQLSEVIGA